MGTSGQSQGPGASTPLVPTWLGDAPAPTLPTPIPPTVTPSAPSAPGNAPSLIPRVPVQQPVLLPFTPVPPKRFQAARTGFSTFSKSGGTNRRSLGRAMSSYVRTSVGGSVRAAVRMGPSRGTASRFAGFLSEGLNRGWDSALRRFDLQGLAGRSASEVFIALTSFLCPDGGTVDESIARDAFLETVAELGEAGTLSLESMSAEQIALVFERFVTHSVENRIVNDIGLRSIELPSDLQAVQNIQDQMQDFVSGAVHDAVEELHFDIAAVTPDRLDGAIMDVYRVTFDFISTLAEAMSQ